MLSQGTPIARIEDVRGLDTERDACFMSKATPAPDSQAVTRIRGAKADRPWPRDSAILNSDRLTLARRTDVRVRVDGAPGRGSIFLVPELARCEGSEIGRHIARRRPPPGTGSYDFRVDTTGRGRSGHQQFVMTVRSGSAVVQWRTGSLLVQALDEQIRDLGSSFTVVVDSAANRGIITVQEGMVSLRNGSITASAGEAYTFGAGQAPRAVTVRAVGLSEIEFHSEKVWQNARSFSLPSVPRPSMPSLPWKRIVAGSVGVGAASVVAWKIWGDKGPPPPPPVRAIVVVTLPL